LPESFKNQTLVSLRNTNARISHRPVEDNLVGCIGAQVNSDGDAALGGELHGIVDKTQQDLTQTIRISHQSVNDLGYYLSGQGEPLVLRPLGQRLQRRGIHLARDTLLPQ